MLLPLRKFTKKQYSFDRGPLKMKGRINCIFLFMTKKLQRKFILKPIKYQCCPHIETSQLICCANQLTGFYIRAPMALNELI